MKPSELSALYVSRGIVLWVEDDLTRTYLRALWQDPEIRFLVAGGNDAVVAAVRDARVNDHANVFGLRDRDFMDSNHPDWLVQHKQTEVFRPQRHEIENYLIRPDILAGLPPDVNPRGRTADDLRARGRIWAQESLWWMVCRSVIHDARRTITHTFPEHPKWGERADIDDETKARVHLESALLQSEWGVTVSGVTPAFDATWIADRVRVHESQYRAALDDETWAAEWSGKDIFKEMAAYVHVGARRTLAASELAKLTGEWQNRNERTGELWDLHAALRFRGGRPPSIIPAIQPSPVADS